MDDQRGPAHGRRRDGWRDRRDERAERAELRDGRAERRDSSAPWTAGPPGRRGRPVRAALLVALVAQAGAGWAAHAQPEARPVDVWARLLLLAGPVLLVWRHRHPVPVVFGVCGVTLAYLAAGYPYGPVFLAVVVAVPAAVSAGHRYAAWTALGLLWAGHLLVAHWLYRWLPPAGDGPGSWTAELGATAWVLVLAAVAELARTRRERAVRERAERAARERRRADEERLRIARELHDVLAHSISVINVQAGVGLALLDSDPEQARSALTTIKTASKEALGEVRQVLDALRAPGAAPRTPAPGLAELPELVAQAAAAGLTVRVERPDAGASGAGVPPATELAAFRIVQEALTNVIRHSGARTALVRVTRAPGALEVLVTDGGPATGTAAGGSGTGLVGMRERAAALGGTLEAGPEPGGGFRVRAVLPVEEG